MKIVRMARSFGRERDALLAASLFPALPWEAGAPAFPEELLNQLCQPAVGGNWNAWMARPRDLPVGSGLRIVVDRPAALPHGDPVELSTKLITIQQRLSLNLTQLSKVLRVKRPTIYSWMAEEASPHAANLDRIKMLDELAAAWNHLFPEPLGLGLRMPLEGASILQLLERPLVSRPAIQRRMEAIAAERRQKQIPRRPGVLDLMREHNFEPTPEWMAREALDSLSHK